MKQVTWTAFLLCVLLTGCGQSGGSSGSGSKSLFSVWTLASDNTTQVDYDGKYIGWTNQFIVGSCTYEIRIEATSNPNAFLQKTYDVTNPADAACTNDLVPNGGLIGGLDQECTLHDGRLLECCLIYGDPNDPDTCYDYY